MRIWSTPPGGGGGVPRILGIKAFLPTFLRIKPLWSGHAYHRPISPYINKTFWSQKGAKSRIF